MSFVTFAPGCSDAEWIRYGGERPRKACQALPTPDLRYHSVATQQQISQSPTAGCRPHLKDRHRHEDVSGGKFP